MKRLIPILLLALTACNSGDNKIMEAAKYNLMDKLMSFAEDGQIAYGHQDDLAYGHAWLVTDWESDDLKRSDV